MYRNDKEKYYLKKAQESVGKTAKDLTILEVLGMRVYGGARQTFVKCRCSCGKVKELPLSQVLYGNVRSCGHKKIQNLKKN